MKEAVTLLMDHARAIHVQAEQAFAVSLVKLEETRNKAFDKSKALISAAQEICPHDGERRFEDDHDCHNNVHWKNEYCADCDKYLGHS